MRLSVNVKPFNELLPAELYAILRLRSEIFVVEQNCVYLDMDNKDQLSHHLMLSNKNNDLLAYARLLPPGLSYTEMSIGRVVTSAAVRGTGAGRVLMNTAIEQCRNIFGTGPIRIGAQAYIKSFYASLGFKDDGEPYEEDGIPHIEMIKLDVGDI